MRMHIHCPGSLTDGLDSPARGESRWSQNLARVLAKAGHEVIVTGGGIPKWGTGQPVDNVRLIPESYPKVFFERFGDFDLHMDSAWWEGKEPKVKAKKNLILKWSMEDYTRTKPLPDNQFICFPLNMNRAQFYEDRCVNKDKTFFLPLPLGPKFHEPNFDKAGLLWSCKDIDREQLIKDNARLMLEDVLTPLLEKETCLYVVWLMLDWLKKAGLNADVREGKDVAVNELVPYHEIRRILSDCKLVVPVNAPGSVLDAAYLGVPSLEWADGGFFNWVGQRYGMLIESGATAERITEVIEKFITDEDLYSKYVKDIQYELRFNTDGYALECFNEIIKQIF